MKLFTITLLVLLTTLLSGQATPGTVDISVTTKPNGKGYSPKHVLAIWIEDNSGAFVKTLKLNADKRKQYLYSWNSASAGNVTDASTGATVGSHTTHTVTWDCKTTGGVVISDGDYSLFVEYTSEHAQGPLTSVVFTKEAETFTIQPPDEAYFIDLNIVFTPESTTGIERYNSPLLFAVYPNPIDDQLFIELNMAPSNTISLNLYSADMKLVKELWNGMVTAGDHILNFNLETEVINPGTYFLVLSGDNHLSARQIIINR